VTRKEEWGRCGDVFWVPQSPTFLSGVCFIRVGTQLLATGRRIGFRPDTVSAGSAWEETDRRYRGPVHFGWEWGGGAGPSAKASGGG
jgi:hypothetical protein